MSKQESLPLLLKSLRLSVVAQHYKRLTEQANHESWDYQRYLSELLYLELEQRHDNGLKRLLKEAQLPTGKMLSHYQFDEVSGLKAQALHALIDQRDWIRQGHNVLIFGASGLGKTHLAAAIGYGVVAHGVKVKFIAATTMAQQLQKAREELQLDALLKKLDRYELLILDDIGYVKPSNAEGQVLFELIAHRYERHSLIITSNQAFSEWDGIFGDSMMTVAAIDRLVHKAKIFQIEGESYRKKQALKHSR